MDVGAVLRAMKATAIPDGVRGLWTVRRRHVSVEHAIAHRRRFPDQPAAPGTHVYLYCLTPETMHLPPGDVVMVDHDPELRTHLEFVRRARGDVLVTGLGLGCVVRGLLENPAVTHVDVVEREAHVLDLVAPHMPQTFRLAIHHADALRFVEKHRRRRWDSAWHDLWSDPNRKDDHLVLTHQRLLLALRRRVGVQGAWQFPRRFARLLVPMGAWGIGARARLA